MSDQFLSSHVLPRLRVSFAVAAPTSLSETLQNQDAGLPPPSYNEATKIPRLSYIDFPPKCTGEGGILSPPTFERFNKLVARANVWLQNHPDVVVQSLETVNYETNSATVGQMVDTTTVSSFGHGQHGVIALKVLRMWFGPRNVDNSVGVQQYGYLNITPACIDPGGITHKPRFESLAITIDKLNAAFAKKPLPGNIINIERIWTKFRQHCRWVDADRCHFHDRHEIPTCHLYAFRIFYETGLETPVIIGYQDFVPALKQSTGKVTETFTEIVNRANIWVSNNQCLHVTNYQTLLCHAKFPNMPDLDKTLVVSYRSPDQIQTLRVWFQQFPNEFPSAFGVGYRRLLCRTFCPSRNDSIWRNVFVASHYESLGDLRQRISDWLAENSDVCIISAETSCLKAEISGRISNGESTYIPSSCGDSPSWIKILRIYYDSSLTNNLLPVGTSPSPVQNASPSNPCAIS